MSRPDTSTVPAAATPASAAADPLEFRLLGPLEVRRGGRLVAVEAIQQRIILARLLLTANRRVTTAELIDRVWGDERPPTARAILHNQILRLRQVLEPDPAGRPQVLCTSRPGYVVRADPQRIDLCRFQRLAGHGRQALAAGDAAGAAPLLREALSLWRGPLLDDVAAATGRSWAEMDRAETLRARALEARIDADLRLGRSAGTVEELTGLIRRDPLRPHLHGLLMMALCRCDRRGEALTIYQQASRALGREFGGASGAALQHLAEQQAAVPAELGRADSTGRGT